MNQSFRGFPRTSVLVVLGIVALMNRETFADTNLVSNKFWMVNGADDLATNASSISVSVKGRAVGGFSELAFSYNMGGTNVVPVCLVKGSGEIQMAVPNGPFGGTFFLTGYWDCDAGYVPTMLISNLDIRLKGSKALEMKGRIFNGVSMAAKDFQLTVFSPKADLMEAELSYTLTATTNFCVDDAVHTNRDDFQAVRMASNYLSPEANENNIARFVKVTSHICVLEYCSTTRKSFCYALSDADQLVVTNGSPILGGTMSLMNDGSTGTNTPTLTVKFMSPGAGSFKPQGTTSATLDPTAQNVNYWANWQRVKSPYKAKKKVLKLKYMLQVTPPQALSCDYSY
jgi:hypothetical protein